MKNVVFYLPVNYPDKTSFFQLLKALDESGVGFVELGIPTMDAYMDGPLIKDALATVMTEGFTREDLIAVLSTIKSRFSFSVILMTYESGRQNYHLDRLSTELYDGILCVDAPIVFCKTFLHNIAKKKYTPLRLKFFSDYFGLDRAFLSRKLSPVKLKMCA